MNTTTQAPLSDPRSEALPIQETLTTSILTTITQTPDPTDCIQHCGNAPLQLLRSAPRAALQLAHEKLHTWPYQDVPPCWRRLHTDASLALVARMLQTSPPPPPLLQPPLERPAPSDQSLDTAPRKRVKLTHRTADVACLVECVAVVDRAVIISGAAGRQEFIQHILLRLEQLLTLTPSPPSPSPFPSTFAIPPPPSLRTTHPIPLLPAPPSHTHFQQHLNTHGPPLIIPNAIDHWPARTRWHSPSYLLSRTIQGHRLVPIELGSSYVDSGWTQRFMPFRVFLETYLLNPHPPTIGYLAQHDLLQQIPALKSDVSIPDYCWTSPPPPPPEGNPPPPLDEPLLNSWLGPAGTKTPLHTDPYHNILAQVVGYKYVRVYAPSESHKLYPRGDTGAGFSLANTSAVDVGVFRPGRAEAGGGEGEGEDGEVDMQRVEQEKQFPLFAGAQFHEAILRPGDCLYLPPGHWHYVESLTASFSVSFWWN